MKLKNFYGLHSSGSYLYNYRENFFSKNNVSVVTNLIQKNLNKMKIKRNTLKNKIIMNVGSGRECLGLLKFNPKKYIIMIYQM